MTNPTEFDPAVETTTEMTSSRRRLWIEAGLVIAFWTFLFLLTIGERATDVQGSASLWSLGLAHTAFENVLWLLATPGFFWLTRRYSPERTTWPRALLLYLAVALCTAVAVDYVTHVLVPIFPPPYRFFRSLLGLNFAGELVISSVVLTAGVARAYALRYDQRQKEALQYKAQANALKAQLADARLSALRMQINPHFLFNTLNSISALAAENPNGVQKMLARLSALLRRTLEGDPNQEVPLEKELSFVRDYLEIQRMRLNDRLTFVERVDEDLHDALVPDLILQPLVENAITHGATDETDGAVRIVVDARHNPESGQLVVSIRDDGPGDAEEARKRAANEDRVGLSNTRKRLEALYGSEGSLDLSDAPEGGLQATITVPYHTATEVRTSPSP